jgi:hypothetical protein
MTIKTHQANLNLTVKGTNNMWKVQNIKRMNIVIITISMTIIKKMITIIIIQKEMITMKKEVEMIKHIIVAHMIITKQWFLQKIINNRNTKIKQINIPSIKINILIQLKSILTIKTLKEEIHTISKQDTKIVDRNINRNFLVLNKIYIVSIQQINFFNSILILFLIKFFFKWELYTSKYCGEGRIENSFFKLKSFFNVLHLKFFQFQKLHCFNFKVHLN